MKAGLHDIIVAAVAQLQEQFPDCRAAGR